MSLTRNNLGYGILLDILRLEVGEVEKTGVDLDILEGYQREVHKPHTIFRNGEGKWHHIDLLKI